MNGAIHGGGELHVCMTRNACAGPGGCGYLRVEAERSVPGGAAWRRARRVFEQRMFEADAPPGPGLAPPGGPVPGRGGAGAGGTTSGS
ncbi:hypothetical protein [Actinomadura litoris]|uniref:Uncharacterized protein n=1 Tax=Actinomadura litoris TaxID=2678616 RepID=A0A7K1L568_9ACTN|nr:hypothetical protein [Actinomadura litoris]MUN39574.1 hypothetical protein [Actinomadura litoris]